MYTNDKAEPMGGLSSFRDLSETKDAVVQPINCFKVRITVHKIQLITYLHKGLYGGGDCD